MDCSPPVSSVYGISRQEYWNRLPIPTPEDLPDPGIKSRSLASPALAGGLFTKPPYLFIQQTFVEETLYALRYTEDGAGGGRGETGQAEGRTMGRWMAGWLGSPSDHMR